MVISPLPMQIAVSLEMVALISGERFLIPFVLEIWT